MCLEILSEITVLIQMVGKVKTFVKTRGRFFQIFVIFLEKLNFKCLEIFHFLHLHLEEQRGKEFQNFFLYCNKINNSYISYQSRHF